MFAFFQPLWCALMIRGAAQMPGVVRGHQRAAVHYKGAWLELRLHIASFLPETSWRKEDHLYLSLPLVREWVSVEMEVRVLTVFCTFLACSFGVVFSTQEHRNHTGLGTSLALRNLSMKHRSRYPLYMMQLYRSFRTADSSSLVAVNTLTTQSDNPSAHSSDSVLSLMARGE